MASISTDRKGNRRILFSGPNRKRKIIYLGGVPMKDGADRQGPRREPGGGGAGRTRPGPRDIGVGGNPR